ncbi:acetyltransferas-like protein [Leptodontidium sp. MPI-SDFR-AT-0119]|nr:acetyltransferas-like protein [Leptodontidium sp. MPI-SDFR-AT-0119]
MPYQVHPVIPIDAPGLANTMMSAFHTDQHWRLLWGSKPLPEIINDCTARLPWNLITSRSVKRHLKVVDTDTGEIVGYSRYILPENCEEMHWLEAQVRELSAEERVAFEERWKSVTENWKMRGLNYKHLEEFGPELERVEEGIMKEGGPYVSVDYMTTHPSHQRKGVASLMLEEALRNIDEAGLKAIVMSHSAGRKMYEDHGFERVQTVTQDDSKYGSTEPFVHYFLVRQPLGDNSGARFWLLTKFQGSHSIHRRKCMER